MLRKTKGMTVGQDDYWSNENVADASSACSPTSPQPNVRSAAHVSQDYWDRYDAAQGWSSSIAGAVHVSMYVCACVVVWM